MYGNNILSTNITGTDIYQNDRLFKSRAYLVTQPTPDVFSLFNVLNKTHHRSKRRMIGQGINDKAMRDFEPTMMSHVDTFLRELVKSCTPISGPIPVEMTDRCRYLGMDIVGQLGFGADLELQTNKKNRFMLPGMDTSKFRSNLYIQFPLLKKADMELFMYLFMLTPQMRYYRMIRDLILARRSEDKHAKKDLYSFVIDLKDPETGKGVRLRDIWAEAAFFIPAGGDTTATAMTALFFYLSRYADSYNRLATEIRSTFADASEIRAGPKLNSCVFLRARINETLRISPPIPTILWREYPRSGDTSEPLIIDGHVIPPGTEVGVNIYSIHHNGEYFPEPFVFKPERWLPGELDSPSPEELKLMHEAFAPFSIGSRGCAGKSMAYMEISLVFAKTLWYMDFEQVTGDRSFASRGAEEFSIKDRFGALHHGPYLKFRLREDRWKGLFDEA